ncbi:FHA domain-containing protein [Anaeromyxobacter oryzisoli]|uniref:FHA domain-containing protein n=1 Tax=Anaeromyxobacter oryzisoli TaxID=2925408 RepID=UPI001F5A905F|nr:FHA domain-containing protein [Anaeromyxobacter sp. SG63]
MRRAVEILVPGSPPAAAHVDAPCTAGGSHADGVLLSGVASGALLLSPCAAGLVVEARVAGVRAAGSALPPAARRLLRPGERAEVLGVGLVVPEEGGSSDTRELAASLLRAAVHGEAAVAGAHLLVLTGPRAGARLPLGSEQVIGRGRSAAVRLPDPLASRRHARLTILPDRAHLEDLGAKNGVRVNGVRVAGRTAVAAGDEIALGETLLALVLPGESPPAERQEPPRAIAPSASRRRWPGAAPLGAAALLALSAAALAVSTW